MADELSDDELEAQALAELEGEGEEPEVEEEEVHEEEPQEEEEPEELAPEGDDEAEESDEIAEPKVDDEESGYGFKLNKPIPIKARGMEFQIGTEKELVDLAHKGFDYFKKTQELAEWRKSIDVLTKSGMSLDELQRFADFKSGNKEAISATLGAYNIDPDYIEPEDANTYQPSQMYSSNTNEVDAVVEDIRSNPEHAENFKRVATTLPDDFVNEVASDANLLAHFSDHVKRGLAERVIPEAIKAQIINGGKFMDHYSRIGQVMSDQEAQSQATPVAKETPVMSERERGLRNKASSPGRGSSKPSFKADADSIWDMSDEDFNKLSSSDVS